MRKVIFGGANSLDNFIARDDGTVDWLIWSDEVTEIMNKAWPRFDTILMGRKTYEAAIANAPKPKDGEGKDLYAGIRTYVISRTLKKGERDGVEVVAGEPGKFVGKLKKQKGKDICIMGGGELAAALFEAGVIDEIGFNVHPVLLGTGIPLFHKMKRQIDLELLECRRMKTGCVYLSYKIKR